MQIRYGRLSGLIAAAALLAGVGGSPAVAGHPLHAAPQGAAMTTATANKLSDDLDALLTDPRLNGGNAGLVVREAATGTIVYSRNGDKRFNPGSNEKLLTSAAALDTLGPDYRFTTSLAYTGTRSGTTLTGNLFLKGTGDPTTTAAAYDELAAKVAAAGIRTVTGALIADDFWFDSTRLGDEWAWNDEPYAYAAQISALTVAADDDLNTGIVKVTASPGASAGKPPVLTVTPANTYVTLVNSATTGAAGSTATIAATRKHGQNTITVTGSVPLASSVTKSATVDEPTPYAAAIFRAALAKRGVTVTRPVTLFGLTPTTATALGSRQSPTLAQILPTFLKLSNNGHAEILTKAMGRKVSAEGSWSAGLKAISAFLTRSGVDAATLQLGDGSGLSRLDLLTPEQVTKLLVVAQSKSWYAPWYAALPIAGNPDRMIGGTLTNRMRNTAAANNVHAKTGTLTSVSALSGYVTNAAGQKLTFSILEKDFLGDPPKSLEDAIAVTLANSGGAATATKRDLARMPKQRAQRDDPTTSFDERAVECSWTARGC